MRKYNERLNIIKDKFKEKLDIYCPYENIKLDVDYFIPFIKQRAKRKVLSKNGMIKPSLLVEIDSVIYSAINSILNNLTNGEVK